MSDPTYNQTEPTRPILGDSDAGTSTSFQSGSETSGGVTESTKEAAGNVASTLKEETRGVAHDAKYQARDLYHQVRREVSDQGSTQQQRAASGLHSLAGEFDQMAGGVQEGGMATDLAQQAASRMRSLASWLESREPGDVIEEVRSFARRRPGTFIATAAGLGLLAGRMTRGLTDSSDESGSGQTSRLSGSGARTAGVTQYSYGETPSAEIPTASLAGGVQGTTYTTGSRLDEGPFEERVTSPSTSNAYRETDERGELA